MSRLYWSDEPDPRLPWPKPPGTVVRVWQERGEGGVWLGPYAQTCMQAAPGEIVARSWQWDAPGGWRQTGEVRVTDLDALPTPAPRSGPAGGGAD